MHIVYGITKANWGGAQVYLYTLATAAKTQGHTVTVLTGGDSGSGGGQGRLHERLAAVGIPVHTIRALARDIGASDDLRAVRELYTVLRDLRPDVLHVNSSKMGMLGAMAARASRVPRIIFTAHGWPHREPRSLAWRGVVWIGSWLTVVLSHVTVVVSAADMCSAPALGMRKKIVLIHNGVGAFELMARDAARDALMEHHRSLGHYGFWFVMNAELHPNKGVDVAVQAFAEVAQMNADVALVICGDGEDRTHIAALVHALQVEDRVFMLGFLENARYYLAAADCYLMPSRKEGLPMALLEAGYAGLSVIASTTGGIPEVIEDGVTGYLVSPTDRAALVARMHDLCSPSAQSENARLGAALKRRVSERFSEEVMVQTTLRQYRSI